MLLCVVSNCCLSPYLNIAGLRLRRGKMLVGSCKVLRFSVTERLGTLILTQTAFVVDTADTGAGCFVVLAVICVLCSLLFSLRQVSVRIFRVVNTARLVCNC